MRRCAAILGHLAGHPQSSRGAGPARARCQPCSDGGRNGGSSDDDDGDDGMDDDELARMLAEQVRAPPTPLTGLSLSTPAAEQALDEDDDDDILGLDDPDEDELLEQLRERDPGTWQPAALALRELWKNQEGPMALDELEAAMAPLGSIDSRESAGTALDKVVKSLRALADEYPGPWSPDVCWQRHAGLWLTMCGRRRVGDAGERAGHLRAHARQPRGVDQDGPAGARQAASPLRLPREVPPPFPRPS
jgi:hypothetical protein